MSNNMKPENAYSQRVQEDNHFRKIAESIKGLSVRHYAMLRQWLLLQPTLEDWKRMMES